MSNEDLARHELELHGNDEEVLTALFGPKISDAKGGGRELDKGLVYQMRNFKEGKAGVKIHLRDKVIIAVIILAVESARLIFG